MITREIWLKTARRVNSYSPYKSKENKYVKEFLEFYFFAEKTYVFISTNIWDEPLKRATGADDIDEILRNIKYH